MTRRYNVFLTLTCDQCGTQADWQGQNEAHVNHMAREEGWLVPPHGAYVREIKVLCPTHETNRQIRLAEMRGE